MSPTSDRTVRDFVHSLGLDAYLVGGAVRDELLGKPHKDQDFVVPRVGHGELRAALAPHGRVEDLEVAGRLVGVRLYPRDPEVRALAPGGIEFAPPRTERSTGPGRHDFEIVAAADIPLEEDMRRRDFTINAMARRLATDELLDPFGGVGDLERRVLRTVSAESFREDPLRLLRGLRFVSELDLDPDEQTLRQMREDAGGIRLVSGERIGGGLAADGLGELSRLLLGAQPAKALRLARDTGVLVEVLPEFERVVGVDLRTERQPYPLDEHIFRVVQATADHRMPLEVRVAALYHDVAKGALEGGHAAMGARLAQRALGRLRYPKEFSKHVVALVASHSFALDDIDEAFARRLLAEHGLERARHLTLLKQADLEAKRGTEDELAAVGRLQTLLEQEASQPHRLADLAVDGTDLITAGFATGPELGRVLDDLLDRVVDDPSLNTRERLLELAEELR